jgi:hypothetical protein
MTSHLDHLLAHTMLLCAQQEADLDFRISQLGGGQIIPAGFEVLSYDPGQHRCDYCHSGHTEAVNCVNCGAPK